MSETRETCETPEDCDAICSICDKPVAYKWLNGFVSEPHNVLIADQVFHTECWDRIVDVEHAPAKKEPSK